MVMGCKRGMIYEQKPVINIFLGEIEKNDIQTSEKL
jgi:hypothetical protein